MTMMLAPNNNSSRPSLRDEHGHLVGDRFRRPHHLLHCWSVVAPVTKSMTTIQLLVILLLLLFVVLLDVRCFHPVVVVHAYTANVYLPIIKSQQKHQKQQQDHQQRRWRRKQQFLPTSTTTWSSSSRSLLLHASAASSSDEMQKTTSSSDSMRATAAPSFDPKYYTPPGQSIGTSFSRSGSSASQFPKTQQRITLQRFISNYVKDNPELRDLENVIMAVQLACKTIANLVHRAGLVYSIQNEVTTTDDSSSSENSSGNDMYSDGRYYSMKRLDKLSTAVLKNALKFTGDVKMIVPEAKEILPDEQPGQHQPGVLIAYDDHNLVCLDPLDGSGNADASICTGTVFGIFSKEGHVKSSSSINDGGGSDDQKNGGDSDIQLDDEASLLEAVLQPARRMRAAGYCLYSSATVLVFSLGSSVYGFTLDPSGEFVLTHDKLTIPKRGNVYSCNEANSEGWTNEGWKEYLRNLKLGQGETNQRYALRYVGSMVGDIHRTLLYGGVFAYPSNHLYKPQGNLQLLYKSAPLAFLMNQAGGEACDETGADLLDVRPERIHQKSPVFMGSSNDMQELKKYLTK